MITWQVAQELRAGWAVNIGFGISANVPRILLEEGHHGKVAWVIEQGAVGGILLVQIRLREQRRAFVASPHQFSYFQAGGSIALSSRFWKSTPRSVNVSRLSATPHRTAGAGGFVDITARARKIVFSGNFNAGAKMHLEGGKLVIDKEGKLAKIVPRWIRCPSRASAVMQGQDVSYVTERC